MTKQLKDALKKQKKSTRQAKLQISGSLGIPIGGQKLVEVPNRNSFVYVKLRDNQNEVIQAFNNKVAPSYGLPVIVERQHNRYVVLDVDTIRYQSDWNSFAPYLPRHGNTHSFNTESGGGGDIVWVHNRQFMPALVIPSGSVGAPNVLMSGYSLKNLDGTWKYVGDTGTQNLTPYKPVTGTQAVMVLVYLDTVSGNPYLMVGSGSYFPANLTGTAQILPYVPTVTNTNHIPLSAIRLVTGTSTIGWGNIYDVRQFYYNLTGSSGGGTSISIQDEGVGIGSADTLNFVGSPVSVTLAGSTARIFITGSSGGVANLTGTSIGLPNKIALTDSSGFLTTDPSLAWGLSSGKGFLEWGANVVGKVFNAGYIGYQLFDNDFDIVGAGTGSGDRWVRIYDNLRANHMQPGSLQILTMPNTFVWLNATGTFVTANNAFQKSVNITGSDLMMGVDGGTDQSYLFPLTNLAGAVVYTDVLGTFLDSVTITATGTFSSCPYKPTANAITNSIPWPEGGILSNMSFRKSTTQPASGSMVVTLLINNVATALTITVPAGTAGASTHDDNTHQVIIAAGDLVRWSFQNNATAASGALTSITMRLNKRATA
jgi:hypothetical protein